MKKIAVASIIQESCSFNVVNATMRDFKDTYFKLGSDVVNIPEKEWVIGGFVATMKPRHHQLEGIISAFAGAGGHLTDGTFSELKGMLLSGLKKTGKVDAVFLSLMGAMAAETELDPTGAILSEVRNLVGKDCFIGAAVDHHGNFTNRMFKAADVIVSYDMQPHDFSACGAKAARVMLDIWDNKRTPHGAMIKIPLLTPQDHFLTAEQPMKEWFDLARQIEKEPGVIVASPFPVHPWLDVPEMGWTSLVYADTAGKAQICAERLAQRAWDLRKEFWKSSRLSLADTIAAANAEPKGLVVISDTGDSVWGGAPGDSMALIGEMLKQGLSGPALVPVFDPEAMEQAIKAGKGQKITLQLGGKLTAQFAPSLKITGTVGGIAEAGNLDFGDGRIAKVDRSVLFECGNQNNLKIAIQERADYSSNHPSLYQKLGQNVEKAQMVVLKTAGNFQYFKKYQSRLIRADSPGATQSDLPGLKWKNIPRPTYPFDDIQDWRRG